MTADQKEEKLQETSPEALLARIGGDVDCFKRNCQDLEDPSRREKLCAGIQRISDMLSSVQKELSEPVQPLVEEEKDCPVNDSGLHTPPQLITVFSDHQPGFDEGLSESVKPLMEEGKDCSVNGSGLHTPPQLIPVISDHQLGFDSALEASNLYYGKQSKVMEKLTARVFRLLN